MTRYLELNEEHRIRNRIRARREELGLTLTAVADEVELNKGELSQIETGRRVPSPVELARLASALGGEPEQLYPIMEVPDLEEVVGRIGRPRAELEQELEIAPAEREHLRRFAEPVAKPAPRRPQAMDKRTQELRLLELLRAQGADGVTPLEALEQVGSFRLGARVYDLRRAGYNIETHHHRTPGGARVARYVLRETT